MALIDLSPDELLSTTRAVRRRLDTSRPVERSLLEECLELAVQAPTGRNRQRWEFVVVTDADKRRAVAEWWRKGLSDPTQHVPHDGVDRNAQPVGTQPRERASGAALYERLHEVPVLLIPAVHVVRSERPSTVAQANTWGSILPAVWSFMLAARSRGLGTVWTTPHLHYEREVAEVLGIPYESVMQVALIPVAHTIGTTFRPGPRAPLSEVVHWDSW
ncbi:nitroreductase family protein [Saccharothrix sp. 6-C]|uniref:nitroreductase family protein n=1 Tax=Saccharothrix sp. 6-C TaxID=2781735 RepID=UPI001AF3978B|nr:nitroreductase family protein [Saccharothrix sp. 6-C]QQQ79564.1 nitroreductase family protein [Saccharothrix sp. 6-C]